MATTTRSRAGSRHGAAAVRHGRRQPFDRRELERRGWRTTLEYRENHERDAAGLLEAVTTQWRAEGELATSDGAVIAVTATGSNPAAAWRRLRVVAESAESAGSSPSIRRGARR